MLITVTQTRKRQRNFSFDRTVYQKYRAVSDTAINSPRA